MAVVEDITGGYRLKYYSNAGSKSGGVWTGYSGDYATYEITHGTTVNHAKFKKTSGGKIWEQNYTYSAGTEGEWKMAMGARETVSDKTTTTITKSVNADSMMIITYQDFAWGKGMTARKAVVPGSPTTVLWQETFSYNSSGKLQTYTSPTGQIITYTWDGAGRITQASAKFKNATTHQINYSYTSVQVGDTVDDSDFRPRRIIEVIGGVETKRVYFGYYTAGGNVYEVQEVTTTQGQAYGNSGNINTTRVYYGSGAASQERGRLKTLIRDDATRRAYTYTKSGSNLVEVATEQNSVGSVVAGLSTRITTTTNDKGQVLNRQTDAYVGSTWYEAGKESYVYDSAGNVIERYRASGGNQWLVYKASYRGRELTWSEDETLVRTNYTYDDIGRVTLEEIPSASHGSYPTQPARSKAYDWGSYGSGGGCGSCDGDVTIETRSELDPDPAYSESRTYDAAGHPVTYTDENGYMTATNVSYLPGSYGRKETITRPDGKTEVRTYFKNGRLYSITGTGVISEYYDYEPDAATGRMIVKHWFEKDGDEEPEFGEAVRWTETHYDVAGKMIIERTSGYGDELKNTYWYNGLGQLIRVKHEPAGLNLQDTVYSYDALGRRKGTAIDLSGNDVLDHVAVSSMTDRVTENFEYYEFSTYVYRVNETKIFPTNGSSTGVTVHRSRERLSGLGGGTTTKVIEISQEIDEGGNITQTAIYITPSTKVREVRVTPSYTTSLATKVYFNGLLVRENGALTSNYTYYGHDALGRVNSIDKPRLSNNAIITYVSGMNQVATYKDESNRTMTYTYVEASKNGAGQVASVTSSVGNKSTYYEYTAKGFLTRTWGHVPYPVEYVYNSYDELISMNTYQAGNWAAEWQGSETASTTTWVYDGPSGLMTSKKDAANATVSYSYLADGRLYRRTWSAGSTRRTQYNYAAGTGDLSSVQYTVGGSADPNTTNLAYTYHRDGRINTVVDALGTRTMGYDSLLRQTSETLPSFYNNGGTARKITWKRDTASGVNGRLKGFQLGTTSDADFDMEISYAYDSFGRFNQMWTGVQSGAAPINYSYITGTDLLSSRSNPGTSVGYTYHANRDLATNVSNKAGATNRAIYVSTYDGDGRRTVMDGYGSAFSSMNSVRHTYTYNDRDEVTQDLIKRGGTATDTSPTETTQSTLGYTFDAIGNRSQITINGTPRTYDRNEVNEYTGITGVSPAPAYDNDGNLTSAGGVTYSWDGENRLIKVNLGSGNNKIYYTYDHMGRRCRKTVKASNDTTILSDGKYIYEGWNLIAEYNLSGSTLTRQKVHYWGPDISGSRQGAGGVGGLVATKLEVGSTGTYYTGYDPNGNVTEMFNSSGANVAHYEYDAFGKTINSAGTLAATFKMRFSTKFWDDESSLYYYGYRYYDPNHGRWLNRDPIEEEGGLNLYGFVENNGVNRWDYLGQFSLRYSPPSSSSVTPFQLGIEWLTGIGPRHRDFTDGDSFAERMRNHQHIQEQIKEVTDVITRKCGSNCKYVGPYTHPRSSSNYNLGGVQGVAKYLKDYSTLLTFGKFGNLAVTFTGSYSATFTVENIDCCENTADLEIVMNNRSHAASALRLPIVGYTKWWQTHIGQRINRLFQTGPGSPTTQKVNLTETLKLSSDCPSK